MARSSQNTITQSYSGKLGNIVLQRDGVIRSRPDMSKRVLSGKQAEHLSRFEQAKEYARGVWNDPDRSARYATILAGWKRKSGKKNLGIYQLAIRDFMNPPEIKEIIVEDDPGGSRLISVNAADVFEVTGVTVSILGPGGGIAEEGEAVKSDDEHEHRYLLRDPSLLRQGTLIRVTACDLPGNITTKYFDYPC